MAITLDGTAGIIVSGNTNTLSGVTVSRGAGSIATNTAVGASALAGANTGGFTTALGYQAGISNTSGQNTFVGANSGQYVTTGTRNTGVGVSTLGFNNGAVAITSNDNTAYGHATLSLLTSGASNTAVGSKSLENNTTASQGTAIGYQAGYTNTTGQNLVAIGYQAGYTSNASNNTFVGYYSGQATTGTLNTFVGVNGVGYLVSSGTRNTIIGAFSGNLDGLDIRTASNYVVLSDGDGARQITMKEGQTLALDSAVPNSGTGITFPATQSASSDANTLDDYEEGTWTPTQGAGLTVVGAFTSSGFYTKIGRQVFVTGRITGATSVATGSGTLMVGGLPFTVNASASADGFGTAINGAYNVSSSVVADAGSTDIYSISVIPATSNIFFSSTYIV